MLLAVAFALLPLLQQPAAVEGRILDKLTGMPVAGARVILQRSGGSFGTDILETPASTEYVLDAKRVAVLTDEHGRFRFRLDGLTSFLLWVNAKGYVIPEHGGSPANTYTLKPGETKSDIEVRLLRALSLSGRVIGEDTERPLAGCEVFPYSFRRSGPGRFFARTGPSAKTDAHGRFRLERLEPGDYYLQVAEPLARAIEEAKPVEDFRNAAEKVYADSWYPGVAREAALPLTLVEGIAVEGMEIKIPNRRVASIRGRIFGNEHAAERNEVSIMLGASQRQIVG